MLTYQRVLNFSNCAPDAMDALIEYFSPLASEVTIGEPEERPDGKAEATDKFSCDGLKVSAWYLWEPGNPFYMDRVTPTVVLVSDDVALLRKHTTEIERILESHYGVPVYPSTFY